MRIAQIAPLHEAVPPVLYGGTERVVAYLTEALIDMGHDVTLFASGDSCTRARLQPGWPKSLRLDPTIRDCLAPHLLMLEKVRSIAHEFDVLHFHLSYLPFLSFSNVGVPFVTTLHGCLDVPELQPVFDVFPRVPVISVSDAQRTPLERANWMGTVYHGLPEGQFAPRPRICSPQAPPWLAFLGRICPEKRVDLAIAIAAQARLPLKIAAKVDASDKTYFRTEIQPLLGEPTVQFVGEISEKQKSAFLSGARALLFPLGWDEPFGLAMIEAMACGTPVIAFNRGAVPEIITDGLTGFIVDDVRQAVAALAHVDALSRPAIRAQFVARFTAARMAQNYVEIYEALTRGLRPRASQAVSS